MQMKSTWEKFVPDPMKAVGMGKTGRMVMMIGLMLIMVFFIASLVLSSWSAQYWSFDKTAHDAAVVGQTYSNSIAQNVDLVGTWKKIEILRSWSAGAQFLGMGILLMGIGMQLAGILGVLAGQGKFMMEELGPNMKR